MVDTKRILFCNITYMKYYQGITEDDKPTNGGSYVKDNDDAGEKYNFYVRSNGIVLGFVETKYKKGYVDGKNEPKQLHVEKITSGVVKKQESLDDVTVIFCARFPEKKETVIVGWYENATVYRYREFYTDPITGVQEYNIQARPENVYLIDEENRTFSVPRALNKKENPDSIGFGQANVWYANASADEFAFREQVADYLNAYKSNTLCVSDMREVNEVEDIIHDKSGNLHEADKEAVVKIRIGQGKFRQKLLSRDKKCILCGIENPELLISSHIKAWKDCTSATEKLDINNGIMLCSLHDALFDKGLISFDDGGQILFSDKLSDSDRTLAGLDSSCCITMNDIMKHYMAWHRTHTFQK